MESFFSAAAPSRGGLPAGTPGRDKSRGDFALCLDKASLAYLSSPALTPPAGHVQPDCEEPNLLYPPGPEENKLPGVAEELYSKESVPLQKGQLPGGEEVLPAPAEGKGFAGHLQEEVLFQPEIDAEGAAVKGLPPLWQGSGEHGLGELALAEELFPAAESSGTRLFPVETVDVAESASNGPAELLFMPEEASPASRPDSLQLQHDAEFFSLMSGEKLQEESAAEILPPRQENQAGAEEFVLAVAEETGESEISSFLARLGSSPGNEPAGEKGAAGGAVTGQNPGVGEQEPVGEVQAEAFSTGEVEDQVFASVQNFGRTVENLNTPGNFRPAAEISVPADFSGEIIFQIVEQAGHLAMSGAQELRLRLQPEFLGEVLIRVRRLQGVLSAEIITPHLAVKELLEGQLETLRQRFQEANLNVEHLDVLIQDEGKSGFTLAGDDGNQDSPGAFKAQGARENVVAGENRDLSSGLRGEGGRVDCLV